MNAVTWERGSRPWPLIGWLLPFWCVPLVWLLDRDYFAPVFRSPPEAFGLPAGLVVLTLGGVLACLGALVGRASRSRGTAALAFVFLTLPAALITVAMPAVILTLVSQSPASV